MKKIVSILKTWNFNMAPRYDFDYFLQRCKALGNHKFTQVKYDYSSGIYEQSTQNPQGRRYMGQLSPTINRSIKQCWPRPFEPKPITNKHSLINIVEKDLKRNETCQLNRK